MNELDLDYKHLLKKIISVGHEKEDRTGTGTISLFGEQIDHQMSDGFPILTTKKISFHSVIVELLWFLKGDTNIKYLLDNNCHIWDGDAYKRFTSYNENIYTKSEFTKKIQEDDIFCKQWGELGQIYGAGWRRWETVSGKSIDQISNLINELKTNPDSRRLIVNAWNVGEMDNMTLPPCHFAFQCYTYEISDADRLVYSIKNNIPYEKTPLRKISLKWFQRSVDTFLGLPFNITSYGLLLHIIANEVNMIPDTLIGDLGDTHLYKNHIEQAKTQIGNESFTLPSLLFSDEYRNLMNTDLSFSDKIKEFKPSMFKLDDYVSNGVIKAPLSN